MDQQQFFFRVDYLSEIKDGYAGKIHRIEYHDATTWEELLQSIMSGEAIHPVTGERVLFKNILRMEKVNRGVEL